MFKKALALATKIIHKTRKDNIFALSAQLTYYLILSIFPYMILAISLLCNYSHYIYDLLNSISSVLPEQVYSIISNLTSYSAASCYKPHPSVSMLIILWSATSGSAAIINGINTAYGFNSKKNHLSLRIRGIFFTLALMFSMQIIFSLIVAGRTLLLIVKKISLFKGYNFIFLDVVRFSFSFFLIFLILLAAYKFLPYEKVKFSYAYPGAIFAAISSLAGSYVYSRYVSHKLAYISSIYGNLSSLFVFIVWIHILSIIFLTGAEVNYFAEKQGKGQKLD